MFTEDDTFRILRRTPISELKKIINKMANSMVTPDKAYFARVIEDNGWTIQDLHDELSKEYAQYDKQIKKKRNN